MGNCCRWCKWFKDGCCVNGDAFDYEIDLSGFYDEGGLPDAIRKGFRDIEFKRVKKLLASKVSRKLHDDAGKLLIEEFGSFREGLIEDIRESVSSALDLYIKKEFAEGAWIKNPDDFLCDLFW